MLIGVETPGNLSSQLHQHLEGEAILVGDISELDSPSIYFFNGCITESSNEVA
jgi:hypothetical protein